jgi:hypothetical protein
MMRKNVYLTKSELEKLSIAELEAYGMQLEQYSNYCEKKIAKWNKIGAISILMLAFFVTMSIPMLVYAAFEPHEADSYKAAAGVFQTNSANGLYLLDDGGTTGVQVLDGGQVKISNAYTVPTADGSTSQILITDGAGALSFQDASNTGEIVTAGAVITDNAIVRGDGGARGVQDSSVTIDDSGNLALGVAAEVQSVFVTGRAAATPDLTLRATSADQTNILLNASGSTMYNAGALTWSASNTATSWNSGEAAMTFSAYSNDVRAFYVDDANGSWFYFDSTEGQTFPLSIKGYRTGDALRTLTLAVDDGFDNTAVFGGLNKARLEFDQVYIGQYTNAGQANLHVMNGSGIGNVYTNLTTDVISIMEGSGDAYHVLGYGLSAGDEVGWLFDNGGDLSAPDAKFVFINDDHDFFRWQIAGTTVAELSSTGTLSVMADAPSSYALEIYNDGNNANRYGAYIQAGTDNNSDGDVFVQFADGDGNTFDALVSSSGNIIILSASDERLKKNIQTAAIYSDGTLDRLFDGARPFTRKRSGRCRTARLASCGLN